LPPELGQALLAQRQLLRLIESTAKKSEIDVKTALTSDRADERFAAAVVVGEKGMHLANELIELVSDNDVLVRQAARRSLVVLSYYVDAAKKTNQTTKPQAVDYGPKPTAGKYAIKDSAKKWKEWVAKNDASLKKVDISKDGPGSQSGDKTQKKENTDNKKKK
jgi:hypothetical protein